MEFFDIYKIVIIAFLTSTAEGNEFLTLSKISQDMENVLYSVKTPTVTYCHMLCSQDSRCDSIGVTKESDGSPLYDCYLLKKKDDTPKKATNEVRKVDGCQKGKKESKPEPKLINVALNRPSVQISTYQRINLPNDAKYANDGDFDTRSVTKEHTNAWWRVNLGAMYRIRLIKLFLDQYALSRNYYGNIQIETRQTDHGQWILCDLFKTPHKMILETSCQSTTWGSFVRVVDMKVNEVLNLVEVEVYA